MRIHEVDALIDATPHLSQPSYYAYRCGQVPVQRENRSHRDVPVGGELLWDLEDAAENKQPEDWLLPDEHGNVWTDVRWRRVWAHMCETAGIHDVTTYSPQHTTASMAIAAGANVKTIQRMLGHGSTALTLDVHGHLWDEELNTIPVALDAHMAAERECFKARRTRHDSRYVG